MHAVPQLIWMKAIPIYAEQVHNQPCNCYKQDKNKWHPIIFCGLLHPWHLFHWDVNLQLKTYIKSDTWKDELAAQCTLASEIGPWPLLMRQGPQTCNEIERSPYQTFIKDKWRRSQGLFRMNKSGAQDWWRTANCDGIFTPATFTLSAFAEGGAKGVAFEIRITMYQLHLRAFIPKMQLDNFTCQHGYTLFMCLSHCNTTNYQPTKLSVRETPLRLLSNTAVHRIGTSSPPYPLTRLFI